MCVGGYNDSYIWKVLCSPISGEYWFVKPFLIMTVFIPFLNYASDIIPRRVLTVLILVYATYCMRYPGDFLSNRTLLFFALYVMAANLKWFEENSISALLTIMGLSVILVYVQYLFDSQFFKQFGSLWSPFMFLTAASIWGILYKWDIENKLVNRLGSITFMCYLIHDNPNFRTIIWHDLFHCECLYDTNIIIVILHIIFCILFIFAIGYITTLAYEASIGRLLNTNACITISKGVDNVYEKLNEFLQIKSN